MKTGSKSANGKRSKLQLKFNWVSDESSVVPSVSFFIENVAPNYISYSEMQWGRASSVKQWSRNLRSTLMSEFAEAVSPPQKGHASRRRLAWALLDSKLLVGTALILFESKAPNPFCVLEDFLIHREYRSLGVGIRFLSWLEKQIGASGARRVYLESGVSNISAHDFFTRSGYKGVAQVMSKCLQTP